MKAIDIRSFSTSYKEHQVFKNFNLSFEQGHIVGLLGPNGCGKTTLLKSIAGQNLEYTGQIEILGEAYSHKSKSAISYLPDKFCLNKNERVQDSLNYMTRFFPDFDEKQAINLLNGFNLSLKAKIKSLSKGMKEKLQIALVISRHSPIYILDEPLSGVDPAAREEIISTILANYTQNSLLIISTHLVQDVESLLDDVVFLNNGNIALQGNVDDIRNQFGKSLNSIFKELYQCSYI